MATVNGFRDVASPRVDLCLSVDTHGAQWKVRSSGSTTSEHRRSCPRGAPGGNLRVDRTSKVEHTSGEPITTVVEVPVYSQRREGGDHGTGTPVRYDKRREEQTKTYSYDFIPYTPATGPIHESRCLIVGPGVPVPRGGVP